MVSTCETWPSTVTVCCVCPTGSEKSTTLCAPTVSVMPLWTTVENPAFEPALRIADAQIGDSEASLRVAGRGLRLPGPDVASPGPPRRRYRCAGSIGDRSKNGRCGALRG